MPPEAYALVTLFLVCSALSGIGAVRLARRVGGPGRAPAYILPTLAAFGAFFVVGHRLGLSIGPEIELFGFQVALVGDIAIGFAAALIVALLQAMFVRGRRGRAPGQPPRTSPTSPGSSPVATGMSARDQSLNEPG
jgi:hypothetical protein